MNKKVYFIRHAKSIDNFEYENNLSQKDSDSSLHESGKEESYKASKRIKKIPFNIIISSDLKRSKETAEIIIGKNKKSIIYSELFRERYDKENFKDFKQRVNKAKKYIESLEVEKVLIVTHSQFMKMFLANIMYEKLTENIYKKTHDFFRVVNTGISVFNHNTEGKFKGWQLRCWNDFSHQE